MSDVARPAPQLDFGSSEGAPSVSTRTIRSNLLNLDFAVLILLRALMAFVLVVLFVAINYQVWQLIVQAFESDVELLRAKVIQPDQRLVTDKVLITLITATAVEVAVCIAAVVRYLFPGKPRNPETSGSGSGSGTGA